MYSSDNSSNKSSHSGKTRRSDNTDVSYGSYGSYNSISSPPKFNECVTNNIKAAGVIPFTIINNELYFLFQRTVRPQTSKNIGWNDFGGKKEQSYEDSLDIAARELSEETSCLFYLSDIITNKIEPNINLNYTKKQYSELFENLKDNANNYYSQNTIDDLKNIIPLATQHYITKLSNDMINFKIKDIYMTYLMYVNYIPAEYLPKSEDVHVNYSERYIRECKWIKYSDLLNIVDDDFHRRIKVMHLKNKIKTLHDKKFFHKYF
jgi:hypothetical protein